MTLASDINSMYAHTKQTYDSLEALGASMPEDKNLENLATAFDSLPIEPHPRFGHLYTTANPKGIDLPTYEDWEALCVSSPYSPPPFTFSFGTVNREDVTGLIIGNEVDNVGEAFMANCQNLISIKGVEKLKTIGKYFLYECINFNSPISLHPELTTIPQSFLAYCRSFNYPLIIPNNVTLIGGQFMLYCSAFNSPITFSNSLQTIQTSGGGYIGGFMSECNAFNQPIVFPNSLQDIQSGGLVHCDNFSESVTLPSSSTPIYINKYMLMSSDNFIGPLVCNCPPDTSSSSTNDTFLTTTNVNSPKYQEGVVLTGPYAQQWKNYLPNKTTSPYRKIVLG